MSGKIRPLSFSTRGCVIVRHIYKAYIHVQIILHADFFAVLATIAQNICNPFIPDKRRNMEGRGKREGTREKNKNIQVTKQLPLGLEHSFHLLFPTTRMYNRTPWIDTNLVITIYLTLNLPFSIPPPNKKTMERENKAGSFAAWHCKHRPRRLSLFSKWLSASNSCGPPNENHIQVSSGGTKQLSPTSHRQDVLVTGSTFDRWLAKKLQWWPWQPEVCAWAVV